MANRIDGNRTEEATPRGFFIKTTREVDEIWNWLSFLSSPRNVENLLLKRIVTGRFGINHSLLLEKKKRAKDSGRQNSLFSIIGEADVKAHSRRIPRYITQAKQLFQAAKHVSEIASPILFYYGMQSLAKALILSMYRYDSPHPKAFFTHGLGIDRTTYNRVTTKPLGFFSRFHDCYSTVPEMYLDEMTFSLEELLSANPELIVEYGLVYEKDPNIRERLAEIHLKADVDLGIYEIPPIKGVRLDIMDSMFMSMFILSNKARYQPEEWIEEIETGKEGFILRSFLTKTERRFPNIILNRIWGDTFVFGPPARWG